MSDVIPSVHRTTKFRLFTIISIAIALSLSGIAWSKSEMQSRHACQTIQVIAKISADTLASTIASNKVILPRLSFPGLSKRELLHLAQVNIEREKRHQYELENAAKIQC